MDRDELVMLVASNIQSAMQRRGTNRGGKLEVSKFLP